MGIEKTEAELPEYIRRKKLRNLRIKKNNNFVKWCWSWESYAKLFVSSTILLSMLALSCLSLASIVCYRVYIKTKVFPNDTRLQIVIGDGNQLK